MSTKAKRKVLGRGLGALIPSEKSNLTSLSKPEAGVFECPIEKLVPNEDQPRQSFDESKLRELTKSVLEKGIIQPLVVRKQEDKYQIVAGERRWRASKLAGLKLVPVIVKDLGDAEMVEIALIENIQREDLNPLEEAEAYRQLVEEHGLTQEQLAKRVGKQRSSVANMLRLLRLPTDVQHYLMTGELSMGHARAILGIEGSGAQSAMAQKVVKDKLSVRDCENYVRQAPSKSSSKKAGLRKNRYSAEQYELVERLQRSLATKVDLVHGKKGGKLVIHYYSLDDLDRVLSLVEGKSINCT
jgi:ParB family chromosome partitioning protein